MKNLKKCPICNSDKLIFLFKNYDKNLGIKEEFSMKKCMKCSLILLDPQLERKDYDKFYPPKEYYSFGKLNKGIKTKLKIRLYNIYFSESKNYFLRLLFLPFVFMLRGAKIQKDLRLLDIGCGSGQYLYEMKKSGLKVYGVEPGDFNEDESNLEGLNITRGFLGEVKLKKIKKRNFDIVTLNHVLEHVENPLDLIKEVERIIKKDGLFIVGVPNSNSLAYAIFRKNWYQLDFPRHLINYSDKNLLEILQKNNFKIIKIRYNSRPSQFVVSLYYSIGIRNPPKIITSLLYTLFLPLTWIVNILKIGDQIEIWCEKEY